MPAPSTDVPAPQPPSSGPSLAHTAGWFLAGGAVTAVFSGSLARIAPNASTAEVLAVGMIVPCFTWVVHLAASALAMPALRRDRYWSTLGKVCLLGSVALLPAGVLNLTLSHPPGWLSAANVLASVGLMAGDLFRRCRRSDISAWWPAAWCLTITVNMGLFLWASRGWWAD